MRQHEPAQHEEEVDREITSRNQLAQPPARHMIQDHRKRSDTPEPIKQQEALT